ncbi:hypothetical protein [Texcoconibacillus texcoconensis]|uniref:Uncharacterized protein n=1 Tax=Texcoconibacillus texcoconensis TaxID=1095777 RepID=A0A840QUH4_9BACI|nr:hypothetical protein [Texcoconibacillus texcoconensis]MBB5175035.1 hypothetical protein [Texcoconibacillus texcoconensis]
MTILRKTRTNQRRSSSNRKGELVATTYIGTQWMADKAIYEPSELEYLNYEEETTGSFQDLMDRLQSSDYTSMDSARNAGVQNEWEVYQFFAQDEVNAPNEVFQFIGNDGKVDYFTDEEIEQIASWERGTPYPIDDIEGHHMEVVHKNPNDFELAADHENILFATSDAHHEHLHAGNFQNETAQEYFGMQTSAQEKLEMTLVHQQSEMIPGVFSYGAISVGGTAALFAITGLVIEGIKLKNDPRPWMVKREELIRQGVSLSVMGGALGLVGYTTNTTFSHLLAGVSLPILEQSFTDILALNGAFLAITVTSGLLKYMYDKKNGMDAEEARQKFESVMKVAVTEFAVFQAIGVGADVATGLASDVLGDALIPDPTGVLIAARLVYSLGKAGMKMNDVYEQKQSLQLCRKERFTQLFYDAFYEIDGQGQPRIGQ